MVRESDLELALAFASLVQLERAIHAVNALVIPAMALPPHRFEQLAKAVSGIDLQHSLDRRYDRKITVHVGLVAIH